MRTLVIDPGTTTGWVIHTSSEYVNGAIHIWGQTPYDDFADFILDGVLEYDRIVLESFVINAKTHQLGQAGIHQTLDLIGVIRHHCRRNDIELVEQTPGKRNAATDDVLRELGWYFAGRHTRDAARHLVMRLWKERKLEWPKRT